MARTGVHRWRWFVPLGRAVAIVVAGYFATAGLVTWIAIWSAHLLPRSEAAILAAMLGVVLLPAIVVWGFADHRSQPFRLAAGTAVALYLASLIPGAAV